MENKEVEFETIKQDINAKNTTKESVIQKDQERNNEERSNHKMNLNGKGRKRQLRDEVKTPLKKQKNVEISKERALPLKYSQLLKIFQYLQMVYNVRSSRRGYLTFADAKASIEKSTRRTFSVKHLAQIKYIYPECLEWTYIEDRDAKITSERLIIRLVISKDKVKCEEMKAKKEEIEMIEEFKQRLYKHAENNGEGEIPRASLPDPKCCELSTATKILSTLSKYHSPSSVKGPRLTIKNNEDENDVIYPCLEFKTPKKHSNEDVIEMASSNFKSKNKNEIKNENEAPMSSTKDIIEKNYLNRILMSTEYIEERKIRHAKSLLPKTFDQIRAIFDKTRGNKKPLPQVLQMLRQTMGGNDIDMSYVKLNLQVLIDNAPHFIKLKSSVNNGPDILILDKECNIKKTKQSLIELSLENETIIIDGKKMNDDIKAFEKSLKKEYQFKI